MSQNLFTRGDRGAKFSTCNLFRYLLWRTWDTRQPQLVFVMLNPSTADAEKNDPTVERCQRRAEMGGFGGVQVLNVFAFRATDPDVMKAAPDPIGPENDAYLMRAATSALAGGCTVVAAWGHHAAFKERDAYVRRMFRTVGVPLYCLGTTAGGYPRHPLYVSYDVQPQVFQAQP